MPIAFSDPSGFVPAICRASITSLPNQWKKPAWLKMKFGAPLPICVPQGLGPKSCADMRVGSPWYHTPSCEVSP